MSNSVELLSRDGKNLSFNAKKCLMCGLCVEICKNVRNAIELAYPTKNPRKTAIKHNAEQCVLCGWCAINCPFGALELKINGDKTIVESSEPGVVVLRGMNLNLDNCLGCRRCEDICPQGAIEVGGKMKLIANECTHCGLCQDHCPTGSIWVDSTRRKLEIDLGSCIRCGACENFCPNNLIKIRCLDCLLCLGKTAPAQKISHLCVESSVNVDKNKCIYCGLCELSCPTHSIKVTKPFNGHMTIEQAKCPEDCTICVDLCASSAIKKIGKDVKIDKNACIYCGTCYHICPRNAINFERKSVGIVDDKGRLVMFV